MESIATNRQQMLEKLEAEKAKDDEKEKEAMKENYSLFLNIVMVVNYFLYYKKKEDSQKNSNIFILELYFMLHRFF